MNRQLTLTYAGIRKQNLFAIRYHWLPCRYFVYAAHNSVLFSYTDRQHLGTWINRATDQQGYTLDYAFSLRSTKFALGCILHSALPPTASHFRWFAMARDVLDMTSCEAWILVNTFCMGQLLCAACVVWNQIWHHEGRTGEWKPSPCSREKPLVCVCLAGQDVFLCGFAGALAGALTCGSTLLNRNLHLDAIALAKKTRNLKSKKDN